MVSVPFAYDFCTNRRKMDKITEQILFKTPKKFKKCRTFGFSFVKKALTFFVKTDIIEKYRRVVGILFL